jgi:RNA polymerase sigma-70 factor (ECF subfamily)
VTVDSQIDAALVKAAQNGDQASIQLLFERLLPRTRNLVRYLVREDRDVDDMSQQALLHVWRGLDGYRGDGRFQAYADRIVARTVFATLRQRPKETVRLEEDGEGSQVAATNVDATTYVQRRELARALDRLPTEQRAALVMHRILGWSVEETAREMEVNVETLRSRLRLGLGRLKRQLVDEERKSIGTLRIGEVPG